MLQRDRLAERELGAAVDGGVGLPVEREVDRQHAAGARAGALAVVGHAA